MKAYLKTLKLSEGQFSSEKSIRLADYNREETSGFFENEHIKDGKLEVIAGLEENRLVLVKLPGRTFEAPGDKGYLGVKKSDLEYVA